MGLLYRITGVGILVCGKRLILRVSIDLCRRLAVERIEKHSRKYLMDVEKIFAPRQRYELENLLERS